MAGRAASKITLPLDTGNTGPKVQTSTVSQGPDTVHRHHIVWERKEAVLGVYAATSATLSVSATAQNGTSTGFLWIHVPAAVTGKKIRIRKLVVKSNVSAATPTCPTIPRVLATRFTFTGTASGAAVTAAKLDASAPAPVLDMRTAVTGITPTLVAAIATVFVPAFHLTGTAANTQFTSNSEDNLVEADDEDDFIVLAPGEGLVVWQADAGTTSDIRRLVVDIKWDEIDVS